MSAWRRNSDVFDRVLSPYTSTGRRLSQPQPLMSPVAPSRTGFCEALEIKNPPTFCNIPFVYKDVDVPVSKTYCPNHRLCYYPVWVGDHIERCGNLRRSVDKKFCTVHAPMEELCGN